MTVDSQNIEAVSSRTKPTYLTRPSFAQAVLSCPKCSAAMEPMLLSVKDNGTQDVWWTCSEVKSKKCLFPLNMPQDVFWVTRSAQDIEKDEVPPPNLSNLPIRYQYLYPSLFKYTRKSTHGSRQSSHESTRSGASFGSIGSRASTPSVSSVDNSTNVADSSTNQVENSSSIWDTDEAAKSRTAIRLNAMPKLKVVMTEKKTFIPSIVGNRALAFASSYRQHERASNSILSKFKINGDKKTTAEARELAKKKVIKMLSGAKPPQFTRIPPSHVQEMKKAVIEHVKKRRAERQQLAELKKLNEKRNEVVDIDDLVKAKLTKNKREYEQRRLERAREARMAAARMSRTAGIQPSTPAMPGYEEEEEEENGASGAHTEAAAYATTPPYMAGATSPIPGTSSFNHYDNQFPNEFDFGGESTDMDWSGLDHSGEVPSYGHDDTNVVSPFAELGLLDEDDLMGIEGDQRIEHAFEAIADVFGDEFEDQFADLSQYN